MLNMEIKDILTEVRLYLGTVLSREKLSPTAEATRLKLLNRLQPQSSNPYLDMTKSSTLSAKAKSWEGGSYEQVLPDVLEASQTATGGGGGGYSGSLSRRTKLLWVGTLRKYWASFKEGRLCLAGSPSDPRPLSQLDLAGYTARHVLTLQGKKDLAFELVSPGKKTYQFVAANEEELEGWVEAVNSWRGSPCRQLPSPPPPPTAGAQQQQQQQQHEEVTQPFSSQHQQAETYDTPDSRLRPVLQEYEHMSSPSVTSFYHSIDEKHRQAQEQLYKNVGHDLYYNLFPVTDTEEIYQVISEDKVGKMGDHQLYEPVDSQPPSRVSR